MNIINDFSEVSIELGNEMNEQIDKGNLGEVKAISGDLIHNLFFFTTKSTSEGLDLEVTLSYY